MDAEVKAAFRRAIASIVPKVQPLLSKITEPMYVWRRDPTAPQQTWTGQEEQRPAFLYIYRAIEREYQELCKDFAEKLLRKYPEFNELQGLPTFGTGRVVAAQIPWNAITHLYQSQSISEVDAIALDSIANEFEQYLDKSTVTLLCSTVLLNFRVGQDKIDLPDGLSIRRVSDEEASRLRHRDYLSSVFGPASRIGGMFDEFVVEAEFSEEKISGERVHGGESAFGWFHQRIHLVLLSLRTFKSGPVGYDQLRFTPRDYYPLPVSGHRFSDHHVPTGIFNLTATEVELFRQHSALVFQLKESAIALACSRLADAETRTNPRDRLLDAVIGMESILLAASSERRGELSYRFALNYSTLQTNPNERFTAFQVARKLYDLRSTLAHGGDIPSGNVKIAGQDRSFFQVAQQACDALREIIKYYLPHSAISSYKQPDYWQKRIFGIE